MIRSRLLLFQCLSPLHAGTGQGVGLIDLPIAREKSTHVPCVPGSSLKGALRAGCEDPARQKKVFGPEPDHADEHAGAAQFSDLTLLFLPVRSLRGTFAWVTSGYLLRRLARDLADLGAKDLPASIPPVAEEGNCAVPSESTRLTTRDGVLVLEDLDLKRSVSTEFGAWVEWLAKRLYPDGMLHANEWRDALVAQTALLHDDTFSYLLETATEVTARIRLAKDTRTVERGALWYEESLPVESLLWGVASAIPVREGRAGEIVGVETVFETLAELCQRPVQLGGKATVGRGMGRLRLVEV